MSNIRLIISREYLYRIHKKSFILLTFLTPFLFAALVFVPFWLSSFENQETLTIRIMDTTGKYAPLFKDTNTYHFVRDEQGMENYRQANDKEIFAFLQITGDLLENPKAATLYSEKQLPENLRQLINKTLKRQIGNDKLDSFHIPHLKEIMEACQINFNIQAIQWNDNGSERHSSVWVASIIGCIFTLLIYMFILLYGAMVMQGVIEEKTSRIVEVIVSSVKPFDLMMGKIIGIGLVGLTQVFLWIIITSVLIVSGSAYLSTSVDPALISASQLENEWIEPLKTIPFTEIGLLFILYFMGGYLLYSALFAAIGSSTNSQEDTQQFMLPVTLMLIFALYTGIYSLENPDGPMAFWCSIFPFTSPIVMMVRMPFGVPAWEMFLSIGILYVSAFAVTWLSAKIYRIGILMYGKRPDFKEIIKWLHYK